MNIKIFKNLGFNEKEIKVYLTLLQLGSITASKISKETNIDRATCYRYLDSLIHKGTVSHVIKNNVKYFTAAHPEKILKDIEEKKQDFKKVLPELISLANIPKDETVAEVYTGKEGIKTVLREILRTKKDHYVLGDEGHFLNLMPEFFKKFINTCLKYKIKEKILCSEKVKKDIQEFDYKFSQTRALPHNFILPTTSLIYDDKLVIFNWILPYSTVVIKNKNITESYNNYFDILWKISKK